MVKILKKLMVLLDRKQKLQMVGLVIIMLIGAILEAFSVAAILPVVNVVLTPDYVNSSPYISWVYNFFHFPNEKVFGKVFGVAIMVALVVIFIVKNIFIHLEYKLLYRFIFTNQFSTSERMMKNYIRREYAFFLSADTAVIQRTITSDVNNMYALIQSLLTLVSEVIVFICIAAFLLWNNPVMTAILAVLLIVTLFLIKIFIKPVMKKAGQENQDYYSALFKHISQTVMGIKEVKITGRENYFVREYQKCGQGYVNAVQKYTLYNNVPRLIIEVVCIAGIIGYFLYIFLTNGNPTEMMTTVSVFVMGACEHDDRRCLHTSVTAQISIHVKKSENVIGYHSVGRYVEDIGLGKYPGHPSEGKTPGEGRNRAFRYLLPLSDHAGCEYFRACESDHSDRNECRNRRYDRCRKVHHCGYSVRSFKGSGRKHHGRRAGYFCRRKLPEVA